MATALPGHPPRQGSSLRRWPESSRPAERPASAEAVAQEPGVTKQGLLYRFSAKHALLVGIHEDLAAWIEQELLEASGKEPEGARLVRTYPGVCQGDVEGSEHGGDGPDH